jgi:peroxiredoxin
MAQLRLDFDRFSSLDTVVLVVGPEGPEAFSKYWSQNNLPFEGLPDPEHKVLKLFGQEVNLFKMGRMPAMLLVDKKGQVRFAHYGHDMADIPENEDVLDTIRRMLDQQ